MTKCYELICRNLSRNFIIQSILPQCANNGTFSLFPFLLLYGTNLFHLKLKDIGSVCTTYCHTNLCIFKVTRQKPSLQLLKHYDHHQLIEWSSSMLIVLVRQSHITSCLNSISSLPLTEIEDSKKTNKKC